MLLFTVVLGGCSVTHTAGTAETGNSSGYAASPTAVSVIGNGRALAGSSANGTASIVATTIGVDVVDDLGSARTIPTDLDLPLSSVMMSPDGQTAVLISGITGAEIWRMDPELELVTELDPLIDAAFTSDGSAVVVTYPTEVWTYPTTSDATATLLLEAPDDGAFGAATFTPDGSYVAAAVTSGAVDLLTLDPNAGAVAHDVFTEPGWTVDAAQMSATHDRIVLEVIPGDPFQKILAAWNTGSETIEWQTGAGDIPPGAVWSLGIDGGILLSDSTGLRRLAPDGTLTSETPLDGQREVVATVATSVGYTVALADGSLLFTDTAGNVVNTVSPAGGALTDVRALTAVPGTLAVDSRGAVRVWDANGALMNELSAFVAGGVNDVDVSRDGTSIAFGTRDGIAAVTTVVDPPPPVELVHPEGNVDAVAFSADGSTLLTGVGERLGDIAFDDTVSLWNLGDDQRRYQFDGDGEDVNGCSNFRNVVEYSPDGNTFAASSHDFTVSLHDATSGEVIHVFPPHRSSVLDFAYSPDGSQFVTTADDGDVRVWNLGDYSLAAEYLGPPGGYFSIAFEADGSSLVVSDLTGMIRMIDTMTGSETLAFDGPKNRTGGLAVSPDGSIVVAGTDQNTVGIWSASTGALLDQLVGHDAPVTSVSFSADGSLLASGSMDATVRVWQIS